MFPKPQPGAEEETDSPAGPRLPEVSVTNSASPAPRKSFPLFAQLLAGTGSPLHPAGVASPFLSVTTPHPRGCWLGCSRFVTCTSVSWIGALLPCSQPSGHSHFLQKGAEASLGNIPPPQSLKSLAPGVSMRPIQRSWALWLPLSLFLHVLVGPVDSCVLAGAEDIALETVARTSVCSNVKD